MSYFKEPEAQFPKKAHLLVFLRRGVKIYKTQTLGKTILYLLLQCVKALLLIKTTHYFVNELLRSSGHAYFAGQEYK